MRKPKATHQIDKTKEMIEKARSQFETSLKNINDPEMQQIIKEFKKALGCANGDPTSPDITKAQQINVQLQSEEYNFLVEYNKREFDGELSLAQLARIFIKRGIKSI